MNAHWNLTQSRCASGRGENFSLGALDSALAETINDAEIAAGEADCADRNDELDRTTEIERLAALEPFSYEVARTDAAKRLNVRAHILDREVARKRREFGLAADDGDSGQGRAVKIDDVLPWPDPVEGDHVASALAAGIKRYVVLSDTAADAIALWVLHTWLVNNFGISPRLGINSPTKGCGKTTVLRFLAHVVRRSKRAGSISPSALFRAVEQFQPTILLDETEKYIEHGSDLHALLNEGHCKGGTVMRVLGDKLELREFAIFGAVAFARNGSLPDDLEQRSIVIRLQRRRADEPLSELRDDRCESLRNTARMAARWAEDMGDIIRGHDPDMGGLINRVADNWRPLFAIADAIGSDWPERARAAASALAPRESDSTRTMLLADIKAIFDEGKERLWSEELAEALAAMEGRPWAEFGKARKPITKNQLAGLLDDFHIKPENVRVGDKVKKGYRKHQFSDAWQRYLAPNTEHGVSETLQRYNADEVDTSCTFQNATHKPDVAFQKCEKGPSNGHCSGVADRNSDTGGHDVSDDNRTSAEQTMPPRGKCGHCGKRGDLQETYYGANTAWLHRDCQAAWQASFDDLDIPAYLDRRGELQVCTGTTPDRAATNGGRL
jgi:putative DNA primase/helicase